MSAPMRTRRRFAYCLSFLLIFIGITGFFLRHILFCGILSLFLFGIGSAWFFLMLLKDKAPKKTSRIITILFHFLFSLFLISFLIIEFPVVKHGLEAASRDGPPDRSLETVLVPGAGLLPNSDKPALLFRLRLEKAEALYKENPSLRIVICGGQGDNEIISEAEAGRNYLLARGIPEDAVTAEAASYDTAENFRNFLALFPDETRVALVTNDFHIYRCTLLAKRYGLEIVPYSMPTPKFFLRVNYFMREYISIIIFYIESEGFVIDTSNFHL